MFACALLFALLRLPSPWETAYWSRFRGPNGSGVSDGAALPSDLSPARAAWRTQVPPGGSSPIVAGERIFLTAHEGRSRLVLCFDRRTGRELWRRAFEASRRGSHSAANDPASPSPVADGANVYALFPDIGLVACSHEGAVRWQVPLGPFKVPHGMAASPILADGAIVVVADQVEGSYVAAFEAQNGAPRWRTARPSLIGGYATPLVLHPATALEACRIVAAGPLELTVYDARDGRKLGSTPGLGVNPISSPVLQDDVVFANTGSVPAFDELAVKLGADRNKDRKISPDEFPDPAYREAVLALDRAFGDGDGTIDTREWDDALELAQKQNVFAALSVDSDKGGASVRWRLTRGLPDVPAPLAYRGVLYLVKDGGIVTAVNPATGEILKQGRIPGAAEPFLASPVAGDGKVFAVSQHGKIAVIRAAAQWEVASVHDLGEECRSTPAIAGGALYVRTASTLYAFGNVTGR